MRGINTNIRDRRSAVPGSYILRIQHPLIRFLSLSVISSAAKSVAEFRVRVKLSGKHRDDSPVMFERVKTW